MTTSLEKEVTLAPKNPVAKYVNPEKDTPEKVDLDPGGIIPNNSMEAPTPVNKQQTHQPSMVCFPSTIGITGNPTRASLDLPSGETLNLE